MTKRDWLKKSSLAVMLSTSLLMFAEGGQASAAVKSGATVASEATDLLGKPYKAAGIGPNNFDSAGYVSYVLSQVGVKVDDTLAAINKGGKSVASSSVQAGDVLLFKSGNSLNYAGVYVGSDKFLYASKGQGKVVQQTLSKVKGDLASVRRYVDTAVQPSPTPGDSTDVSDDSYTTAQIVQLVRAQLGKDYQTNKNGPTQFDAAGLVTYVYGKMGVEVKDTVSALFNTGDKVTSTSDLEPGDIVFFRNGTNTTPSYCGIYVGNGSFIYAAQGEDKVVEKKLSWFSKSYFGARRLHEVDLTQPDPDPGQVVTPPTKPDPTPTPTPTPDNGALGAKLIKSGEKYMGVPYKFGADWADYSGKYFDCSGFTQRVFAENGIKLSRGARAQFSNGVEVDRKDLQVGDLVFFSTGATMKYDKNSINRIGHVGIYAGDNKVLHTYGAGGVRYSTMSKGWWNDHFVRAARVTK